MLPPVNKYEEGSFTWRVGYLSQLMHEEMIESDEFELESGTTTWKLHLFPKRYHDDNWLAIFLHKVRSPQDTVRDVDFQFCIVKQNGGLYLPRSRSVGKDITEDYGWPKFVNCNLLRNDESLLPNGFLTVRCDMRILWKIRSRRGIRSFYNYVQPSVPLVFNSPTSEPATNVHLETPTSPKVVAVCQEPSAPTLTNDDKKTNTTPGGCTSDTKAFEYTWAIPNFRSVNLGPGHALTSPLFSDKTGAALFSGVLYPNGTSQDDTGFVCIGLKLVSGPTMRVDQGVSIVCDTSGNRCYENISKGMMHSDSKKKLEGLTVVERAQLLQEANLLLLRDEQLTIHFWVKIIEFLEEETKPKMDVKPEIEKLVAKLDEVRIESSIEYPVQSSTVTSTSNLASMYDWFEFTWHVKNFDELKLPNGYWMESQLFCDRSGSTAWSLGLYPNGASEDYKGYLASYVQLESTPFDPLDVDFSVSVLDKNGQLVFEDRSIDTYRLLDDGPVGMKLVSRETLFEQAKKVLPKGILSLQVRGKIFKPSIEPSISPVPEAWHSVLTHVWQIEFYPMLEYSTGTACNLPEFEHPSGETVWYGKLYPSGVDADAAGFLSIALGLKSAPVQVLEAKWTVSLLDTVTDSRFYTNWSHGIFKPSDPGSMDTLDYFVPRTELLPAEFSHRLVSNGQLRVHIQIKPVMQSTTDTATTAFASDAATIATTAA